jgi:hypothetical protein
VALELNNVAFCSQYSAANAPKVLFRCIKNCAEIAILGNNPYTDRQLINNMICLLLTMGLYIRPLEEWDRLLPVAQMWIGLRCLIQEAFQRCLNATAPTAGHHGYGPTQPYQQNAFGILGETKSDNEESITNTVATQVAALTYQSQRTQSKAANTSQRHDMQLAQLAANQEAHHTTMYQLIDSLNAIAFNIGNASGRIACFGGGGRGYAGRGRGGRSHMQGRSRGPPNYIKGYPQGGFPPTFGRPIGTHPGLPGGFQSHAAGGVPPYRPLAATVMNGGHGPSGGYVLPRAPPTNQENLHAQPYSNVVKQYSNWNVCYLCGFDVADRYTSMLCPPHLRKVLHQIGFNCQNAQQYTNLGHPCSTRNRHKTQFPTNM